MSNVPQIKPGSTIGILDGGQLGKMSAMAAARLGYKTVVWTPPGDVPATHVATRSIVAPYEDKTAFIQFVQSVDVVTLDFENVPLWLLTLIEKCDWKHVPVRPSRRVLEIAQDRWEEKTFFRSLDIPHASTWTVSQSMTNLENVLAQARFPGIVKTRRDGYDGKGQFLVNSIREMYGPLHKLKDVGCVYEELVDYACEGSVIVARNPEGQVETSPVFENRHDGGILRTSRWPCRSVGEDVQNEAQLIAMQIARKLELEGVLAVEFFFGKDGQVYANELAPRPHNSFHGTIEACSTSQFEQHIRAVCNLPLGDMTPHTPFIMRNLIGSDIDKWQNTLCRSRMTLHIYGKSEAKPGRKMGHETELLR